MTQAKAPSTTSKKKTKSSVGAPSQRSQTTRKGKKAWRKNVDLDDLEGKLEDLRTEERITGYCMSFLLLHSELIQFHSFSDQICFAC